jgi:TetR/AcrR family transcriptional regulator, transcriptional repressor for nem operon
LGRQTQTRERLVETAGELFWQQGYAQTGVSSIMKQARATSGSFYHFFPTKDDLLLAVLDAAAELISTEILAAAEAGSDDPAERVSVLIGAYRDRTGPSTSGFGIPVGTLAGELGPDHAAALRQVEKIYAMLVSRIAEWFVDIDDPLRSAEFVVAALEGASMMAIAGRGRAPFDACAAQMRLYFDELPGGRGSRAEEMPPPDASAIEAGDWKAW